MTRFWSLCLSLVLGGAALAAPPFVEWDTPEGVARLDRCHARVDFFPLANQFEAQINGLFCSIATGTIVLNTLRQYDSAYPKPASANGIPPDFQVYLPPGLNPTLPRFTQEGFFQLFPDGAEREAVFFGKPVDGQRMSPKPFARRPSFIARSA